MSRARHDIGTPSYRGESLEREEAILLSGCRLLERLVLLDERLDLVETVAEVLIAQVRLVCDQPRLRDRRIARELVDLEDCSRKEHSMTLVLLSTCSMSINV